MLGDLASCVALLKIIDRLLSAANDITTEAIAATIDQSRILNRNKRIRIGNEEVEHCRGAFGTSLVVASSTLC